MKVKVIRQLDNSITLEFFNTRGDKLDYTITDIEKDGIGHVYTIDGIRFTRKKRNKSV